jgi:hypothetical protein
MTYGTSGPGRHSNSPLETGRPLKIKSAGQQTKVRTTLWFIGRTLGAVHPPEPVEIDRVEQASQPLIAKWAAAKLNSRQDVPIFNDERFDLNIQRVTFFIQFAPRRIFQFQPLRDLLFDRAHLKNNAAVVGEDAEAFC